MGETIGHWRSKREQVCMWLADETDYFHHQAVLQNTNTLLLKPHMAYVSDWVADLTWFNFDSNNNKSTSVFWPFIYHVIITEEYRKAGALFSPLFWTVINVGVGSIVVMCILLDYIVSKFFF